MEKILKNLVCLVLLFLTSSALAQRMYINQEWESSSGSQGAVDRTASKLDNNDNMIVVSNSMNSLGNTDVTIKKFNSEGTLLWQQDYNGVANGDDYGIQLVINASNEIVIAANVYVGIDNSDFLLLKYSSTGVLMSSATWGATAGGHDVPSDLVVDNSGNIYITGGTETSNTYSDYVILKYNSSAILQWATTYDYVGLHDAATGIGLNGNSIAVIGASASSLTNWDYATLNIAANSGAILGTQRTSVTGAGLDQPLAVKIDGGNNIYITGYVEVNGQKDIRTLKFDASYNLQWTANYTGSYDDVANSIDIDNSGNVYIAGLTKTAAGRTNFLTVKYNSSGIQQWAREFGDGNGIDTYGADHAVVVDNEKLMVVGTLDNDGTKDFLVIAYSLSGGLVFTENYDANGADDEASNITIDGDSFFVTGTSTTNGVRSTTVVKYDTWSKAETPVYDTDGNPAAVDNELLIRFDPNYLIGDKINNTEITWGLLSDFVSQPALATISDSVGFDIKGLHCYKMFPSLTEFDTIVMNSSGDTIYLPPFYASFGVKLPFNTDDTAAYFNFNKAAPQVWVTAYNQYAITYATANDDLYLSNQEGLHGTVFPNADINVEPAWDFTTGDSTIVVGVFDSGINNKHEDMSTNGAVSGSVVRDGWDYVNNVNFDTYTYPDNYGHGSGVSSIIGARRNNNLGMAGIGGGDGSSRGVTLHDMKIFDTIPGSCSPMLVSPLSVAVGAITDGALISDIHIQTKQNIQNHSWGHGGGINFFVREAFIICYKRDITMVAAAGNYGLWNQNPCLYQSAMASMDDNYVLKVGGNDSTGLRADFASCGAFLDVIAPATVNLYANIDKYSDTYVDSLAIDTCQAGVQDGTSYSAPHVAGVAALMMSYYKQVGAPFQLAPEDIEELMSRFTTDVTAGPNQAGYDNQTGWGIANAGAIFDSIEFPKFRIQHEQFDAPLNNVLVSYTGLETCVEQSYYGVAAGYADVIAHKVRVSNTHAIPYGYKIIGAWGRGSGSKKFMSNQHNANAQCLPSSINSGAIPNASDPEINFFDLSDTYASFDGYLYEILNPWTSNILGFIPPGADTTSTATVAYTLFLVDTIGLYLEEVNNIPDFKLFPNPSNDQVNIQFESEVSSHMTIYITDLMGKAIHESNQGIASTNLVTFSVKDLSPGIYFAILESASGKRVKKFVKK